MRRTSRRALRLEVLEERRLLAGDVLFRVNAGGPLLAADPSWEADTAASPSPYNNALTGNSATNSTTAAINMSHASIPAGTPMALFQTDRFDKPGPPNLEWNFPVSPGEYEVRLYFAETWSGAFATGVRIFDVNIEGIKVLDDYDIFADVGALTGVVKSFIVSSDANIDIDFPRNIQNPVIKGIEILTSGDEQLGSLAASSSSVNFGTVVIGQTANRQLTLTNDGPAGSPSVTINPSQSSISPSGSPFSFSYQQTSPIVLAPGQSTVVTVTYAPTSNASNSATLAIPHSGGNSPLSIALSGTGATQIPISFGKSTLAGTTNLDRPTSLQFGPDGRLYVSQQNGLIRAYTITRDGANDYRVVSEEIISLIQQIANHDDDGTPNSSVNTRLVTGLLVTGSAQNPVLYVTSSDPRIGGGSSGTDLNLDTNSSMVSRLTWNGSAWQRLDLVRGLPRSEENHAANGLQLDAAANKLYVAIGGNTNMGAPSNNFSLLPEFALSAAILVIDLNVIGNTTYDLPTLNDETRSGTSDPNDPFGGNDGKNQAKLVPGGPVQVFAPGFRNPYDLVITSQGRMYTVDNGPNAGWGDVPVGEGPGGTATNAPNEPGVTHGDGLHYITGAGYYGGHPNPTRSNPNNTFNTSIPQSPVSTGNPVESDYRAPGTENGALTVFGDSTNGIVEYRATNFGGAMQGDLLIASFDNTIKRVKLNAAGDQVVLSTNLFSNVGFRPLDVTSPATGPFAGSIWVADIATETIIVFEPSDQSSGNPNDFDGDGYSNDDESANGTDPHSAADVPPDNDQDFISNLSDNNDDNDAQLDTSDPFAVDANNGATTPVGVFFDWENEGADEGGILGLGFTGLMTNGVADYESLFDPQAVTAGGAAGVFTIDSATAGTARGAANTQQQAFQLGVNVANETSPFTAKTSVLGPFSGLVPQPGQEMGMYIGTGDQNNFVQIVLSGDNGGSIQLMKEVGGVFSVAATQSLALPGPSFVELHLTVDPVANVVQARYSVDGAALVNLGTPLSIPPAWIATTLAVGLIARDPTGSGAMPVTWDFLGVESDAPTSGNPEAFLLIDPQGSLLTASTFVTDSYRLENNSTGNIRIQSIRIDVSTALLPDVIFDPTGEGGNDVFKPFTPDSGAVEVGLVGHTMSNPHDDGFDVLEVQFADFDPGEVFTFSIDMEPTSIKGSEAPGPSNSGKISGMELTGSTVTIVYSDGTTTETQPFRTADSGRASQTTAVVGLPPAPGLTLVGTPTPPAVVTNPNQTLRVSGPAGSSVRLLQVEAALYTAGVPGGGFDIDPFEANKAIVLSELAATIGPSGVVDIPVTLTKTEPEGGYNYFVATIADATGRTGGVSTRVVLKLEPVSNSAARVNIYPNGTLNNSSTFTNGSIHIINQSTSGENITSVTINLSTSLLPDIVYDPNGVAGDVVGKTFTPNSGAAATGVLGHSFGGAHAGGFDSLTINFSDFNPGETFTFSIDIDPTSVQGAGQPGPQQSASISGLEASGATISVHFNDGKLRTGDAFAVSGSKVNSHVVLDNTVPATPGISMIGVANTPAIVTSASQTIRVTGPAGATARLLQTEGGLFLTGVPNGGFDIDPFEVNKVIFVKHSTVTIGANGFVDVPVVLNDSHERGGVNRFTAVIQTSDGHTGEVSNTVTVALNDYPTSTGSTGTVTLLAGDYDESGKVDDSDYEVWRSWYGEVGELLCDGNRNGVADIADLVVWRANLGASRSDGSGGLALTSSQLIPGSSDSELAANSLAQTAVTEFQASHRSDSNRVRFSKPSGARSQPSDDVAERGKDLLKLRLQKDERLRSSLDAEFPSLANGRVNSSHDSVETRAEQGALDAAFELIGQRSNAIYSLFVR
ncbi:MAG TPA: malectin domain-containing carbohydrate-binding protein [Lacipirellulaceae bacterium]|nr:malectin domain-containing carbohydrate-binding protein [Lacipirellulaceae bacterium]